MKKIFSIILAFAMTITLANAQTVEKSGLFENTYVTVSGGVVSNTQFGNFTKDNWYKVSPSVGLELGKYITPVVGFSVEGIGLIRTTTSRTFFDESVVLGNGKLNFSNWFGGYPGQPRRVEVVGVLGYGWGHDYAATSYGQYRASDGTVIIYSIARDAGSRSKVAVYSERSNVDPIGACIGEKKSIISRIIDELNGEKIDIVRYDKDPQQFIANALAPAKNLHVVITDPKKQEAIVVVDDDNFSLAIGKKGQNARLASKLTHYKIDIKKTEQAREMGINFRD